MQAGDPIAEEVIASQSIEIRGAAITSLKIHLLMDAMVKVMGVEHWGQSDDDRNLLLDAMHILEYLRDELDYILVDVHPDRIKQKNTQIPNADYRRHEKLRTGVMEILRIHMKSLTPRQGSGIIGVALGEHYCLGCTTSIGCTTLATLYPCYIRRTLTQALDIPNPEGP